MKPVCLLLLIKGRLVKIVVHGFGQVMMIFGLVVIILFHMTGGLMVIIIVSYDRTLLVSWTQGL